MTGCVVSLSNDAWTSAEKVFTDYSAGSITFEAMREAVFDVVARLEQEMVAYDPPWAMSDQEKQRVNVLAMWMFALNKRLMLLENAKRGIETDFSTWPFNHHPPMLMLLQAFEE